MPPTQTKYILDANTFMQASRTYYSFDFAKPFWDALPTYAQLDRIVSIDKVLHEINKGNDALKEWANTQFVEYFYNTETPEILQWYADLVNWVDFQPQYTQAAKDEFMRVTNADAWVIAYAKANDCIVVTAERSSKDAKKRVLMPNVCDEFDIECRDIFKMLQDIGFSFRT